MILAPHHLLLGTTQIDLEIVLQRLPLLIDRLAVAFGDHQIDLHCAHRLALRLGAGLRFDHRFRFVVLDRSIQQRHLDFAR